MSYDSRIDTYKHIQKVQGYLQHVINLLHIRSLYHDQSKLVPPEVEYFDKYTPKLPFVRYGSDDYKEYLGELKVALDHHYAANSHHPEHYPGGIKEMNLMDLVEMLCDWWAASERSLDGDIRTSIQVNQMRFGFSDELAEIFENTVRYLTDPYERV